tara:strand:+ start:232 stop:585 length:354 start_codon:yes stop_codon:yes gene_type:complete
MAKRVLTDLAVEHNLLVGGATSPSDWDNAIILKNLSAAAGDEIEHHGMIYCVNGEIYVQDEDRNRTNISPHDEKGKWVFKSENSKTGKSVLIHMEDLVAAVEEHLGKSFSEIVEPSE